MWVEDKPMRFDTLMRFGPPLHCKWSHMSKLGSDSPAVSLKEDVALENTQIKKGDVVVHHLYGQFPATV